MSDITVTFKNETVLTMDASGSKDLLTQGKYCEDDISISYVKPSGGSVYNNVALGKPITLGFVNGTGGITVQTVDKEITTDYLSTELFPSGSVGIVILYAGYPTNYPGAWCAFSDFDSSQVWQRRTVVSTLSSAPLTMGVYSIPAGISYIRASFRAKGGVVFALLDGDNYNDFIATLKQTFVDGNFSEYVPT